MPKSIIACRTCGEVKPTIEESTFCDCLCTDCFTTNEVYARIGNSDPKYNDKKEFLFRVLSSQDDAELLLYKNGVELISLNNNSVLGTFFEQGTMGSGDQLLYIGYLLDWQSVLINYGAGQYAVKAEMNINNTAVDSFSEVFTLNHYDEDAVDGTVKIVSYMNGYVESSIFDYTGLNWYQEIRIKGIFWDKKPTLISNTFFRSDRTVSQITDQIDFSYTLETEFLPAKLSNYLILQKVLANEIFITDYNKCNTEEYCELPVFVSEIPETQEVMLKRGRTHKITFGDRVQNHKKRNYK